MWRNMPGRCIGALKSNMPLLYHRQVKILDIYIARVTLEFAAATISFVLLGLILWGAELLRPPEDSMQVLWGWLMLAWFGAGLAFTLGGLSERYDLVDKLWPPISYILFPLSGAAFLVDALPRPAQEIVLYLPMLHAVELIRDGYFGSQFVSHHDLSYLFITNMLLSVGGLSLIRQIGLKAGEQ
jgi:ABC-2 type transport system permease protein/capsular polysaccharide transport system permease protein